MNDKPDKPKKSEKPTKQPKPKGSGSGTTSGETTATSRLRTTPSPEAVSVVTETWKHTSGPFTGNLFRALSATSLTLALADEARKLAKCVKASTVSTGEGERRAREALHVADHAKRASELLRNPRVLDFVSATTVEAIREEMSKLVGVIENGDPELATSETSIVELRIALGDLFGNISDALSKSQRETSEDLRQHQRKLATLAARDLGTFFESIAKKTRHGAWMWFALVLVFSTASVGTMLLLRFRDEERKFEFLGRDWTVDVGDLRVIVIAAVVASLATFAAKQQGTARRLYLASLHRAAASRTAGRLISSTDDAQEAHALTMQLMPGLLQSEAAAQADATGSVGTQVLVSDGAAALAAALKSAGSK